MKFRSVVAAGLVTAVSVFATGCASTVPNQAGRGTEPLTKAQIEELNPEIKIYSNCLVDKTRDYAAGTSDVRLIVDTVIANCRTALMPLNDGMEKMQIASSDRQVHLRVFERSGANVITDLLLKARARAAQPSNKGDQSEARNI